MAGKYGAGSITITYDDAPGGTPRAVTQHVLEMSGVKITSAQELSHAFGDTAEESTPAGLIKVDDITLGGFWDTTATTGPHAVFQAPDDDPQDPTRTLTIVFGDSKTFTVETRLMVYEVMGQNGNLTKFSAVIRPTGAPAWT